MGEKEGKNGASNEVKLDSNVADTSTTAGAGAGVGAGANVNAIDGASASAGDNSLTPLFKDLLILPPLNGKSKDETTISVEDVADAVPLPPIRAEEPVSSLRAALSEVCGYAHLTNYRLELELEKVGNERKKQQLDGRKASEGKNGSVQNASTYTGPDAVVSVPAMVVRSSDKEGGKIVLDDYGDLTPLLEQGLEDGVAFRIVLERYDAASVRDHVTRFRSLLDGNAPTVTSFVDDAISANIGAEVGTESALPDGEKTHSKEEPKTSDEMKKKPEAPVDLNDETKKPPRHMPKYELDQPVAIEGGNLKDFFYLSCGEDAKLYHSANLEALKSAPNLEDGKGQAPKKKKGKKGKGNVEKDAAFEDQKEDDGDPSSEEVMRKMIPRLNELEEKTQVKCTVRYSGFHPPPSWRRAMGDIAYFEVIAPNDEIIHVTAVATGFYVNRSSSVGRNHTFDPSPASKNCFSHELLDCLLLKSESLRSAWGEAVAASKERALLMATSNKDGPFSSLFRVSVRGDFDGYKDPTTASPSQGIDALLHSPSWLVPIPKVKNQNEEAWNHNDTHGYSPPRAEEELGNTFGIDIRSGAVRDWNEELQSAREMPITTLQERIERARVLHKVMTDFGEAALLGVKAISDGQISPMNPNEMMRSQVYLHNNIFFSRAVDAGVETFKIAKGDKAARKSASRDVQCIGTLHRMEKSDLHTLATVLIDYLGTRFVCQSILPGILSGEKTHTLLYGAVEAGSPLVWDKEMHEELEETLGKSLMVATRAVPRQPLTELRLNEIKIAKSASPFFMDRPEEEEKEDLSPTIQSCAPLEAKGIRGSDQRNYVLDLARLTPRDANWVEQSNGGTGRWEKVLEGSACSVKSAGLIPQSLQDDEWTLAILRPELVTKFSKIEMEKWLQSKKQQSNGTKSKEASNGSKNTEGNKENTDQDKPSNDSGSEAASDNKENVADNETDDNITDGKSSLLKDKANRKDDGLPLVATAKLSGNDLEHLKTLRMNVNVFLPDVRSIADFDSEASDQLKKDEERVREASIYLWDHVLPRLTREVRDGTGHQITPDGKSLTELLHQNGINCRYLGRLAMLAQEEEKKDADALSDLKQGKQTKLERRIMPVFWLELLECEMVARAAKHVLDLYLSENGGSAACQPSQTVASFLSALVSEGEETAAQTETRMNKSKGPDEDDFNVLTICDTGGGADAIPPPIRSRSEVWKDIEKEVGRRFRYVLSLYNVNGKASRALYIPLLRRVCQRTGIRLAAKNYELGGKCLCSGGNTSGGRITASYPILPTDVIDIVPLMKHSAAHGEGFVPCAVGPTVGLPPLHISLSDARTALEAAYVQCSARSLSKALELAQEAASLYQRVTDMPAHPGVVRCIDLMATILFEAGEPALASGSAVKALGLLVQIGGFDSADAISAHLVLFQMLLSSGRLDRGVKHLRAAIYLMEILGGPRYVEHSNAYHKLGTVYHGIGSLLTALRFYQEAASRDSCDRLLEGMIAKSTAMVLAGLGQYKLGVETEKRAYHLFSLILGEEHTLTKTSDHTLKKLMKLAVEQGNRLAEDEKKRKEEEAAQAMANQIEAEESAEEGKKNNQNKKKKNKGKKGKK